MGEYRRTCIPAAGHDWLLPLYDPLLKLLGADSARRELVEQAFVRPSHQVLDIGCGTGSLVVLIKRLYPDAEVVGLDPDPKALARARRKVERAGLSAQFDQGFSDELSYPDATFDRVFSSFMFHHLKRDEKSKTLNEARRVLKPGGSLHVLDFGGAGPRRESFLARALHSVEHMRDNFEGRIPALMGEAGFAESNEVAHRATFFGHIAYYSASLPASKAGAA
jgi:cyclopropane fatty-acyl-phospholipid synthase-like methyltransferase